MAVTDGPRAWVDHFRGTDQQLGERYVGTLLAVGGSLSAAGLLAICFIAGWSPIWRVITHAHWILLVVAPLAVAVSHVGYLVAHREVVRAGPGPDLPLGESIKIVSSGFGPVSPRGGFALDNQELQRRGLSKEEAEDRVRVLGLLEYAVLAPVTWVAAIYLMVEGIRAQAGLLPSWVIGVPVGAAIAVGLLSRYRSRGRPPGWWRPLRNQLDALEGLLDLLRSGRRGTLAVLGMALYWAAEITALGACLDTFAHRRGGAAVMIVGYATGYALTRRSLPLAGAGVVEVLMPFALNWVGLPLAASVLAVVGYRACNLWLAMAPAVLATRRLDQGREATAGTRY